MPWYRMDANFLNEEDGEELADRFGPIGISIFAVYLLGRAKMRNRRGLIPGKAWTPKRVAKKIGSSDVTAVTKAMAWIESEYLTKDGANYLIKNWQQYQLDPSHAKRQSRYRLKQKSDVTGRHETSLDGSDYDRTGQDRTELKHSSVLTKVENGQDNVVEVDKTSKSKQQSMIDHIRSKWPEWSLDQVEISVLKLVGGYRHFSVTDWIAVIDEAHLAAAPDLPTFRIHTWINNQARYHDKSRSVTVKTTENCKTCGRASKSFIAGNCFECHDRLNDKGEPATAEQAGQLKELLGQVAEKMSLK